MAFIRLFTFLYAWFDSWSGWFTGYMTFRAVELESSIIAHRWYLLPGASDYFCSRSYNVLMVSIAELDFDPVFRLVLILFTSLPSWLRRGFFFFMFSISCSLGAFLYVVLGFSRSMYLLFLFQWVFWFYFVHYVVSCRSTSSLSYWFQDFKLFP